MTVYLDAVAVQNGAIDSLLLTAAARMSGIPPEPRRICRAALLGAAYAVLAALPGTAFLAAPLFALSAALGMVLLAFGRKTDLLRLTLLFLLLSGACAGLILALNRSFPISALPAALLCLAGSSLLLHGAAVPHPTAIVTVQSSGKTARFLLLQDTGCDLCDPISGKPALLLSREAALRILPDRLHTPLMQLSRTNAAAVFAALPEELRPRFRLLPYRAVGQEQGLLLAFRPDCVLREKTEESLLAAISPAPIAHGRYDGLIGC